MHPAIELLISRIESNPEEFAEKGYGRWSDIISDLESVAPKDEWNVLVGKLTAVHMDAIHKHIMQELCDPVEKPEQKRLFEGKWVSTSVVSTSPEMYKKFKRVSSRSV